MYAYTTYHSDNNAWYRQMAASWARRMIKGGVPGAWALNTDSEVQFALWQLRLTPGERVLDLGCGWGRHSMAFASYGLNVTGLDLSHDLLTLAKYNARRRSLDANWVEADVEHLPLRGPFDAITQFCDNLLTWFADWERTRDVLWNVANLLRPGGRFLLGSEDWQPELPSRSQEYDEWDGGAAVYRQRYDQQSRMVETQTVVFGPAHERLEYRRQTWWPSPYDMESLFAQVGLRVHSRNRTFNGDPFDPAACGLVYVLERDV